ncbi:MAG: hypothetical protein M9906_15720 [Microthrixaceae bacterium]|nr:hypothetical protein [Microthrixaceae bacterium]
MATARFMETWAHGLDVADALGVTASEPPTASAHVAHLGVRTVTSPLHATHSMDPPAEAFRVEELRTVGRDLDVGT